MKTIRALAVGTAAFASGAIAQNLPAPVAASTPAVTLAAPAASVLPPVAPPWQAILRTGTEVPLRLSEGLTTRNKALRVGQRFHLTVAEDVKVSGQIVIPVGSPAMGEVTEVRNKGMWGKSGHLTAQVRDVQVNGRQIRLNGTFDDKGVTGTGGVVAAVVFVPLAGFFTTGTSAEIPAGSSIKAFTDEDVPLSFAAATAPAPLVVAAPPAPLAVSATAPVMAPVASAIPVQQPKAIPVVATVATPVVATAAPAVVAVTPAAAAPADPTVAVAPVPPAPSALAALTATAAKRANYLYTSTGQNGSIYQVNEGPDGSVASVEFIYEGRIIRVPGSTVSAGTKASRLNTSLTTKEISKL